MVSAAIVGAFEDAARAATSCSRSSSRRVVYMADAVGTQTETVLIRGLAAGVTMRAVVRP